MTKRVVDGREVDLTPEEEQAFLDQQALDSAPKTAAELEAEVQGVADAITQNTERDVCIALATVDLALAVRDGTVAGLSTAQVRTLFRDRVVHYLRQRRGL